MQPRRATQFLTPDNMAFPWRQRCEAELIRRSLSSSVQISGDDIRRVRKDVADLNCRTGCLTSRSATSLSVATLEQFTPELYGDAMQCVFERMLLFTWPHRGWHRYVGVYLCLVCIATLPSTNWTARLQRVLVTVYVEDDDVILDRAISTHFSETWYCLLPFEISSFLS